MSDALVGTVVSILTWGMAVAGIVGAFWPPTTNTKKGGWVAGFAVAAIVATWLQYIQAKRSEAAQGKAETAQKETKTHQDLVIKAQDKSLGLQRQLIEANQANAELLRQLEGQTREIKRQSERPIEAIVRLPGPQLLDPVERQRIKSVSDKLSEFIPEGQALLAQCVKERGSAEVEAAANAWFGRVLAFLEKEMGTAYVNRFRDLSDWGFMGVPDNYPADRIGLYHGIRGRVMRLHEFVKELQAKL